MQRPRETDLGITLLNALYEHLGVERKWTHWRRRGFVWWPSGLAQEVWAERGVSRKGHVVFRLHVRMDLFEETAPNSVGGAMLNGWGQRATLSALVRDPARPTRLRLAASVRAHAGNLAWVLPLLCYAAAVQIAEAADLVAQVCQLGAFVGLRPFFSAHPRSGVRLDRAELPAVHGRAAGGDGHDFAGQEMERFGAVLNQPPCVQACSDSEGLTAEFPFPVRAATLQMRTSKDVWAGNGMRTEVNLPLEHLDAESARDCLEWNGCEQDDGRSQAHGIGSWAVTRQGLTHTAFYPNSLFRPGCIANIGLDALLRARWASEERMGFLWDDCCGQVVGDALAAADGRFGPAG